MYGLAGVTDRTTKVRNLEKENGESYRIHLKAKMNSKKGEPQDFSQH